MTKVAKIPKKKARLPATMQQANAASHPFHRMLGEVLLDLGGKDFIAEWAEMYPSEFMRLMMATVPPQQPPAAKGTGTGTGGININLHPGLAPGPLDANPNTIVSDQ